MRIKLCETPCGCLNIYASIELLNIGNNMSIREIVTKWIDDNNIDHEYCEIVFYNTKEGFSECALVEFFDFETFEDFLDYKVQDLTGLFNLEELYLEVAIGGIGGEIDKEDGVHYFIYSRNEHLPKHVHCKKQSKECKCVLETQEIEYKGTNNRNRFNSKEERTIKEYVRKNKEVFVEEWDKRNPYLL